MTPPSEPPIFEIPPSVTVMQNEPIFIQIAAYRPERGDNEGLEVYVDNLPSGSNFSRGRQERDRWIFTPADFGVVELELPSDFSGRFTLEITAVADGTSRRRSLVVNIQSTVNATDAVTTGETTLSMATTEETPVTGEVPTATEGTTRETPEVTRSVPTLTRETPAGTRETTINTGETPTVTGEAITITRDTPDTTEETPVTEEVTTITPVNTVDAPTMTEEIPTTTEEPVNNGRDCHKH